MNKLNVDSEAFWLLLVDMEYNRMNITNHSHTKIMGKKGGGKKLPSDTGAAVTKSFITALKMPKELEHELYR